MSDIVQVTMDPSPSELKRRLKVRRDELADTTLPMKKASIFLDQWVQRNFRGQGSKVGGWKPLVAGGRKKRGGLLDTTAKILQDTGRLRSSFLPFATKNNAGIGSDLPYSSGHEFGEGHLPVRRMLPKKEEVRKDLERVLDNHVGKLTRKKL